MANFQNTVRKDTINTLANNYTQNILKNPYYLFTDKKPFIVDYFNRNTTMTTLDESTRQQYEMIGYNSPVRYNLIEDAFLFATDRIELNFDTTEFGTESDPIESVSYVLPNSWIPYQDDYFIIKHAGDSYLFKVTSVNKDTLDNGSNFYKINWIYDRKNNEDIYKQVIDKYTMIPDNTGTNYKVIIKKEAFDLLKELETLSNRLKMYYQSLFYQDKVQTFIYEYNGYNLYDPYMIEFIKRNNLISGDKYIYVGHATTVPITFGINYSKTYFMALEEKDKDMVGLIGSGATLIKDKNSLFDSRFEDYYKVDYLSDSPFKEPVVTLESEFVNNIKNDIEYTDPKLKFLNIIIRYFNDKDITEELVNSFDDIDLIPNSILFYNIPAIIYVIDDYVKKILSTSK